MRTQRILPVILAVLAASSADAMSRVSSWCEQGAKVVVAPATVGGSPISRSFMQSYPGCTVTVYITGTVTIAPIFSDNSGTPLSNPFSATTLGYWDFYAANGRYDVQISGGGLGAPFTFGDVGTFDAADFIGQPAQSVQFNNGSNPPQLGGAPGFTYNSSTQVMTETGLSGTAGIHEATGYILSDAGFQTPNNSINAFAGANGGVNTGALAIPQTPAQNGSYIRIPPITYNPYNGPPCMDMYGNPVQQPVVLAGDTFGQHDVVMWNGLSPEMPANGSCGVPLNVDLNYGLFINTYFLARGGLSTTQPSYNSIQSLTGGVFANSIEALNYSLVGSHAGVPPLTYLQGFIQGGLFYDTTLSALMLCTQIGCSTTSDAPGTGWVNLSAGGGGGGSPTGAQYTVQFNNPIGSFAGVDDLKFYPTGSAGCSGNTPCLQIGSAVNTGLLAVNGNNTASVNVPNGGITSKWMTPTIFIQSSATTSGTAGLSPSGAGKIFFDGTHYQVSENGGAYVPMLAAAGCPGATSTSQVLYNNAGVCAGSANLSWNNGAQRLTITGTGTVGAPGLLMLSTSVQADQGFAAILQSAPSTALAFNVIQAPTGGLAALSGTFTNYTNGGNFTGALASGPPITLSDTFAAGALSYSITAGCEAVNTGSTWVCLAAGSGGIPGGPTNSIQTNGGSSTFAGVADLVYNNSTKTMTVGAASPNGIVIANGTNTATFSAPTGGVTAKWLYATDSAFWVAESVPANSVAGQSRIYMDSGTGLLRVSQNGAAYVNLVGGGGGGVPSITGTANQVLVNGTTGSPVTTAATLTLPQSIALTSSPQFVAVTATATGGSSAFYANGGTVNLTGQGDATFSGVVNAKALTAGCAYQVNGTCIITNVPDIGSIHNISTTLAGGVFTNTANPAFTGSSSSLGAFNNFWSTSYVATAVANQDQIWSLNGLIVYQMGLAANGNWSLSEPSAGGNPFMQVGVATPAALGTSTVWGTNFATIGGGRFNSTASGGGQYAFTTSNSDFLVDGAGNISSVGQLNVGSVLANGNAGLTATVVVGGGCTLQFNLGWMTSHSGC